MAKSQGSKTTTETTETKGPKFGISQETKSKNQVPFQPTEQHPITKGYLVDVYPDTREMKKDKSTRQVLVFEFKDAEKIRTHYHTEWDLDPSDEDFQSRMDGLNSRIKHIYEEFAAFPVEGVGNKATNFEEFFAAVAEAFNKNGKDGTPIYKDVLIWIKVSYNVSGGAKAQLGFPLFPNFIEKYRQGKDTTLWLNKKYETLKQPEPLRRGNAPSEFPAEAGAEAADTPFPRFPGQD